METSPTPTASHGLFSSRFNSDAVAGNGHGASEIFVYCFSVVHRSRNVAQ
ncbi:MAG: hypothetical protein RL688_1043 [Actinomycetota bacterium]